MTKKHDRHAQDNRPQYTAAAFRAALPFLNHLRECKDRLTTQELSALRAQALDGDIDEAMAALGIVLGRCDYD